MMATKAQPEVVIKVTAEGAGAAAAELEKVADAQGDVAKATDDVADAAKRSADAATGAGSKWSSLVGKLKAGAGAAASASAGLAGVAATLNTDMSEGTKLAVAGLQGLSGVLGAFGPLGQLAATGVSLATAAIATFGSASEFAERQTDGFLEGALKPLIEAFKTTEQAANEATGAIKRVGVAAMDDRALFSPAAMVARTAAIDAHNVKVKEFTEAYDKAAAMERAIAQERARAGGANVVSARQAELDAHNAAASRLNDEIAEDRFQLDKQRRAAEAAAAGTSLAGSGGGGGGGKSAAMSAHEAYLRVNALRLEATAAVEAGVAAIEADYAARKEAAAMASAERLTALYASRAQADREIARMAAEEQAAAAAATQAEWETTFAKLEDSASGFGKEMANAAAASLLFGASFSEVAEQALKALAVQAGGEALMEGARALAALGAYFFTPWNASLLASAKTHALAAAGFAAIAGGAAIGASAIGGGGGGAGSAATAGAGGPPQAFGNERPEEPKESSITLNLAAGQAGRPLSRQDGEAILGALAGLVRGNLGGR